MKLAVSMATPAKFYTLEWRESILKRNRRRQANISAVHGMWDWPKSPGAAKWESFFLLVLLGICLYGTGLACAVDRLWWMRYIPIAWNCFCSAVPAVYLDWSHLTVDSMMIVTRMPLSKLKTI